MYESSMTSDATVPYIAISQVKHSAEKDKTTVRFLAYVNNVRRELIRRWDSERELFYDDIVHLEVSTYAHW